MTASLETDFYPHQAQFYEAFLAPHASRRQLLVAAPGMGKGHVAQALVHRVASTRSDNRVLVLTPSALALDFALRLGAREHRYRIDKVDRRRFRELLSGAGEANGLWGAETVVVMSIDFAKQDDVAPALRETQWDLVVVDEAHALGGQRERLVRQLSDSTRRLLLLTAVDESAAELARAIPDLDVVRWDREITDAEGRKLFVAEARAYHVVEYIRSDEEVAFATDVLEFLDRQTVATDTPQVRFVKGVMSTALASSTSAIEQMLLRLRAQLMDNAYQDLWADPGRADEHEAVLSDEHSRIWPDPQATAAIVDDLVTALEALPRDSKAERLRLLVEELGGGPRARTCIFSAFASTVEYLAEILAESSQRIHTVVGRIPASERDDVVDGFLDEGGVLLLTDGVAQGLNLALAQHVIHYDLPESRLRMEQRWGRLDRVGQEHTVHSYALRDERRSIQAEEQLLRDRGFIE